jgi:hypothetical protein
MAMLGPTSQLAVRTLFMSQDASGSQDGLLEKGGRTIDARSGFWQDGVGMVAQ